MKILLTGASRGLGLKICEVLLSRGDEVFAVSRRQSDALGKLGEQFPDRLRFKSADLSDADAARRAIFAADFVSPETVLGAFVNNAATAYDDIITNMNADKLRAMFEVNTFAPMILAKYAIRNMILHGTRGAIVHISSVSVHTGYKGLAMYAASKGALEAFSKNTAREWGVRGIRSNAVAAGFMQTDMSASLTEEQRAKIYARTSLKSATSAESVAKTVAYLLSDGAASITGQTINTDNGTI